MTLKYRNVFYYFLLVTLRCSHWQDCVLPLQNHDILMKGLGTLDVTFTNFPKQEEKIYSKWKLYTFILVLPSVCRKYPPSGTHCACCLTSIQACHIQQPTFTIQLLSSLNVRSGSQLLWYWQACEATIKRGRSKICTLRRHLRSVAMFHSEVAHILWYNAMRSV